MKKTNFLVLFAFVFFLLGNVEGQERGSFLSIDTDITLASRSIFHGWDITPDDDPVYQPYLGVNLGNSGFTAAFWASIPMDRSLKFYDDLEFLLKYHKKFFANNPFEITFNGYANFIVCPNNHEFDYVDSQKGRKQLFKFHAGIALTRLLPVGRSYVVPYYDIFHFRPAGKADFQSGNFHEVGATYNILTTSKKIDPFKLSAGLGYHDGAWGVDPTWSHSVMGLKSGFDLGWGHLGWSVNYQWTYDDQINCEDEFWYTLSFSKSF